jgi:hypothetical protein
METDVSEERITSIFRVEIQSSKKPAVSRYSSYIGFLGVRGRGLDRPVNQARKSSNPKRVGAIPFLLPSKPYVTGIPADGFTYRLHSAISQKMATFITTTVRTSNPSSLRSFSFE